MSYKLTSTTNILRLADGALIPADLENSDYALYLKWLDAGNIPGTADPAPPPVPASISPRQLRLALLGMGLLDQVEQAVAAQPKAVQIAWQFATEFSRGHDELNALAVAMGFSSADIDALFVAAAAL